MVLCQIRCVSYLNIRRTVGLGIAALLAGQALTLGAGAAPALAAGSKPLACGADTSSFEKLPLVLGLGRLRQVYPAGGQWAEFRLEVRNPTAARCSGVRPVVAFGAWARDLGRADVQLQWDRGRGRGGGWQPVALVSEAGELGGQVGPGSGLTLAAHGAADLPLRMRIGPGAPSGQWLAIAVGLAQERSHGQVVPLPVGISDPYFFRVAPAVRPVRPRPAGRAAARVHRWSVRGPAETPPCCRGGLGSGPGTASAAPC